MRSRLAVPAVLVALTVFAAPAEAGPPWISIQYPANEFDDATRGALLLVHTYHHEVAREFPVVAFAESMVDGARRRLPLEVVATSRTGVWAVRGSLPRGAWVVSATMTDTDTNALATALVAFADGTRLVAVEVPRDRRWNTPRAATQADVDALLAGIGDSSGRRAAGQGAPGVLYAGLALLLLPIGFVARRVRR